MLATLRRQALDLLDGLPTDSPEFLGFRDGAVARWRYEQKAREVDPEIVRAEREDAAKRRRESATDEQPF